MGAVQLSKPRCRGRQRLASIVATRPFYTAEELMPLWPALAIATGFTDKWPSVLKSAKRLGHELDFFGLPRLFDLEYRQYFIVERIHYWRRATKQKKS
jgi:hypothetical protein